MAMFKMNERKSNRVKQYKHICEHMKRVRNERIHERVLVHKQTDKNIHIHTYMLTERTIESERE